VPEGVRRANGVVVTGLETRLHSVRERERERLDYLFDIPFTRRNHPFAALLRLVNPSSSVLKVLQKS
jgi:hypothetical protein